MAFGGHRGGGEDDLYEGFGYRWVAGVSAAALARYGPVHPLPQPLSRAAVPASACVRCGVWRLCGGLSSLQWVAVVVAAGL